MNEYNLAELRRALSPAALYYWTEIPSTNSWALEQIAGQHLIPPAVVLTANQTAGRGRMGRHWQSDVGGLTCSWVLERPRNATNQQPVPVGRLAIATAIAVFHTLAQWLGREKLKVKWPNDILVAEQKICGILIESVIGPTPIDVIGIGINVNLRPLPELNKCRSASETNEPLRKTTSVLDQLGHSVALTEVLTTLHQQLIQNTRRLENSWEELRQDYQSQMFGKQYWMRLETPQGPAEGKCLGIDDQGALIIETMLGPRVIVAGSVVEWIDRGD